jgi:peptide/nickel transport system permease protein
MFRYILRRLMIAVPSLLGISLVLFTVLAMAPGDPFSELVSNPNIPPEALALRQKFGLDDPLMVRYWNWLTAMLQGDWGYSFISRINVETLIMQRIPVTLLVIGSSQLLALCIAIPVGVYAATRPYSIFDQIASTLAFIGFSLPTFFTGILLILFFSIHLDWLPFVYRADIPETGWRFFWEHFKQMIMPVMVLGMFQAGAWTRYVRSAVLDVIRLDYVTTALKRLVRKSGHHKACTPQRLDSRGHFGGAANARHLWWRNCHGANFPSAWHWLSHHQFHAGKRHACCHGRDVCVFHVGDRVQSFGRYFVWLARPSHLLQLKASCLRLLHPITRLGERLGDVSSVTNWQFFAVLSLVSLFWRFCWDLGYGVFLSMKLTSMRECRDHHGPIHWVPMI